MNFRSERIALGRSADFGFLRLAAPSLVCALYGISGVLEGAELVAFWDFEETAGTVVSDRVNDLEALVGGGAELNIAGRFGSGIDLSSDSDGASRIVAETPSVRAATHPSGDFSLLLWVRPTVGDIEDNFVRLIDTSTNSGAITAGYRLMFSGSGDGNETFYFLAETGAVNTAVTHSRTVLPGVWSLIAIRWSELDGVVTINHLAEGDPLEESFVLSNKISAAIEGAIDYGSGTDIHFASQDDNAEATNEFDGLMDDVAFFTGLLTDEEILSVFQNGVGGSFLDAEGGSSPVISVNFHANDSSHLEEHRLSSGEMAGLIPRSGEHWNNVNLGEPRAREGELFEARTLRDDLGNTVAANLSVTGPSSFFVGYAASSANAEVELAIPSHDDDLFNSYLGLNGPSGDGSPADVAVLSVSGLDEAFTEGGYSLVLYSDTDKGPVAGTRQSAFKVSPLGEDSIVVFTEDDSAAPGGSTFAGDYIESDHVDDGSDYSNFVSIDGLTAAEFVLELTSPDGGRGGLSGFQLVANGAQVSGPTISSFAVDDAYLIAGDSGELVWEVSNATELRLEPGAIDVTGLTSFPISPTESTTYTLLAGDGESTVQSSLLVRVGPERPNILVFIVDDMGITDTSVPFVYDDMGEPVVTNFNGFYQTANMEQLAAHGMKFTSAYATPVCSSTRASLMTGFNTTRHGVISQVNPNGVDPNRVSPATSSHCPPNNWKRTGMQADDVTMPMILRDAGYRTLHAGKAHFGATGHYASLPTAIGFDENYGGSSAGAPSSYTGNYGNLPNMGPWENTGLFLTDALTRAMQGAVGEAVADGVPFFAYLSHYAVHTPFTTDPNATGDYSDRVNGGHERFATMIEGMDRSLGSMVTYLDETLGVAEETLIVFLGDNGSDSPATTFDGLPSGRFSDFPQRGKKGSAWEGGMRVPLIVAWAKPDPTHPMQMALPIPQNSREDDLVVVWDLLPTLLSVTETEAPHEFDGFDLSPYLVGSEDSSRPQEMLMYLPIDHRNDFFSVYRKEEWKLIYRFASDSFELYNLDTDPTESQDQSNNESNRVMAMARDMAAEFERTWGIQGRLWPTFCGSSRPYVDDPLVMPNLPGVDTDEDGLSDNLEDANGDGLLNEGETDPTEGDSDGDKLKDGDEVRTGTNPLDASSFFRLEIEPLSSTQLMVSWPSAPGAVYRLEDSLDLEEWDTLSDNIPAADPEGTTSREISVRSEEKFYFLRARLLP